MDQKSLNLHQQIIDRCLSGDREAQFELYQLYAKAMYNVCLRMVNDREEAEDMLQEAFISAFKHLKNYRGDATFGSWLKRIVINRCLNYLKKEHTLMTPLEDEKVDVADEPEQINEAELELSMERVKWGISQLPNGFRAVLSLYLLEGYDHKEIAEVMGITESTSKSQYLRAKKKLRSILENKVNYG